MVNDKLRHFIVGALCMFCAIFGPYIALVAVIFAAVVKEAIDLKFSWEDIYATVGGALILFIPWSFYG